MENFADQAGGCSPGIARQWARAAASAARAVPVGGAEAAAWTVRGLADVATGCLALGVLDLSAPDRSRAGTARLGAAGYSAFRELDKAVADTGIASGGPHAVRLRELRQLAGPVPAWYPRAGPVGVVRPVGRIAWRAARLLTWFSGALVADSAGLPSGTQCPVRTDAQLAWGAACRPSPAEPDLTFSLPVSRRLARRSWMTLPGPPGQPGPCTAIADIPSAGSPMEQQVWRGIHEAAHLDHLAAVTRSGTAAVPIGAEYGAGLLAAESYAMAVELVAAVECLLAGDGDAVRQLGAGFAERAARLPGGAAPASDLADLPTWAEAYVLGPFALLAGDIRAAAPGAAATAALDDSAAGWLGSPLATALAEFTADVASSRLLASLHMRWRAACASCPSAARLTAAAAELLVLAGAPLAGVTLAGSAA